jgi:TPR repeat protein
MLRSRLAHGNVVEFPKGDNLRLDQAIEAFGKDPSPELFERFKSLSQKGMKEADYFLGLMYEDGTNGVPRDLRLALRQYEQCAEEFGYVEAYIAAARLLYHGEEGVSQNHARAFDLYRRVAEGNGHAVACFMLGRMYQRGEGIGKDIVLAREWYGKAITAGNVYGLLNLAMLEWDEGYFARSLWLRLRAGFAAFRIARNNRRDARLRGS